MSGRGNMKLDLKLNLSPPGPGSNNNEAVESAGSSSEMSPKSSCLSSDETMTNNNYDESSSSMLQLAGCPRCLMYVMLSDVDPKCPKCKSTVLLDVFNDDNNNTTKKTPN